MRLKLSDRFSFYCVKKEKHQQNDLQTPQCFPLTSDNTEKLLNPHVDVDPAEELVHVAPPLLQDGAGRLAGLQIVEAGINGSTG